MYVDAGIEIGNNDISMLVVDTFSFGIMVDNFLFVLLSYFQKFLEYYLVIRLNFNFRMKTFLYIMRFPILNLVPNHKKR